MAELIQKLPISFEPLRSNRWILNVTDVPPYLIKNVNLETFTEKEGRKNFKTYTKLTFSIFNIIGYMVQPGDIIQLKKIKLDFLDPVGTVVNGYNMDVEFEKMNFKCDYSNDGLLTHEFIFYVRDLNPLYTNMGELSEKEITNKYKEIKEKES